MHPNKTPFVFVLLFLFVKGYSQVVSAPDTTMIAIDASTFERVEKEAAFPGGTPAWKQFLVKNLNPSVPVDNGAPVGVYTAIVQFIVDTGGNVSNVISLTSWGYGMEKEVMQLIKKSGPWEPARMNGKPVNAYRKQPVTFQVEMDGFTITSKVPHVLFTGMDNELTVEVEKVKNETLTATISQGTITKRSDGIFVARVTRTGKAIVTVYGKRNKEIAAVFFEVRAPAK